MSANTKMVMRSAATLLLACLLICVNLSQLARAAPAAASAASGQSSTTTTTTSTSTSNAGSAAASAGMGANPLYGVQGLLGGVFNTVSMPLNTISGALDQFGVPQIATAPISSVGNWLHQAGTTYGR